jgi:hypothetical protein
VRFGSMASATGWPKRALTDNSKKSRVSGRRFPGKAAFPDNSKKREGLELRPTNRPSD